MDKFYKVCVVLMVLILVLFTYRQYFPKSDPPKPSKYVLVHVNDQPMAMYEGTVEQSPIKLSDNGEWVLIHIVKIKVPMVPNQKAEVLPDPNKGQ